MRTYPAISDHGLIGDLQTAALVATDGTIDWFCTPRFDSPSVFASLLDQERGGRFRIAPSNEEYVTKQLYFPDTAILITRFMTPDGVGEVVDFMPIATRSERPIATGSSGSCGSFEGRWSSSSSVSPGSTTAERPTTSRRQTDGVIFRSEELELSLRGTVPLEPHGADARATWRARSGEVGGVILESAAGDELPRLDPHDVLGHVQRDRPLLA